MLTAKARLKPVEELPEWYKCCPGSIAGHLDAMARLPRFEIKVGSNFISPRVQCNDCGFIKIGVPCVRLIINANTPWPIVLAEVINIREGEDDGEDFCYV